MRPYICIRALACNLCSIVVAVVAPEAMQVACCINGASMSESCSNLRHHPKLGRNLALTIPVPAEAVQAACFLSGASMRASRCDLRRYSKLGRDVALTIIVAAEAV